MRLLIIFLVFFFVISCKQGSVSEYHDYLNLNDTVQYVGKETCKQCHLDIYQSYMRTGMGKSLQYPLKKNSDMDTIISIYDKDKDLNYAPYWQNDSLWIHEYRTNGKDTTHSLKRKVDYIIGSGHHTNSHLFEINGYLHQIPYTFYTQKKIADLPPGYENGNNSRFNREIGTECITCHNAYPHHTEGSFNKYDFVPDGIDCERCHGPGEVHVQQKRKGISVDTSKYIDYSIVNPSKLDLDLQFELCQRCHLQGTSVLHEGKNYFDFKPGMKLSDIFDVYVPRYKNNESFIMASHADRLKQSKCFKSSDMNCITCHNPHKSVQEIDDNFFDKKCMTCHQTCEEKINVSNCASCHMPESSSIDIPHVTITDHKIGIHEENLNKNNVISFLGLHSVNNNSPSNLSKAKAYLKRYESFEQNPFYLDSARVFLDRIQEKDKFIPFIQFLYLNLDYQAIINYAMKYEETEFDNSEDLAVAFSRIGQSYLEFDMIDKSIQYFNKAITISPYKLEFQLKIGTAYVENKDFDKARDCFEKILRLNPYNKQAYSNLGYLYILNKEFYNAKKHLDKAIELDPDYISALENLTLLYILDKKKDKADFYLNKILEIAPDNKRAQKLFENRSQTFD